MGKHGLSCSIPSNEDAVVILLVLVEQACVHDVLDYLIGDAAFAQIGKHPPIILIGFREGEGYGLFFFFLWQPDFRLLCRGVTGVSVVVEQEIHSFPEGHICIILQKGDGVAPFLLVVVKVPSTVLDDDMLGVFEEVPAAPGLYFMPEGLSECREVGKPGDLHFFVGVSAIAHGCVFLLYLSFFSC